MCVWFVEGLLVIATSMVSKQKPDGNGFKRNWKKGISDKINKNGY